MEPPRVTVDADVVVDIRTNPKALKHFTEILSDRGFALEGRARNNVGHRWTKERASFDVLLPDGVGERASGRTSVSGSRTVQAPGGTQALTRTQRLPITLAGHMDDPDNLKAQATAKDRQRILRMVMKAPETHSGWDRLEGGTAVRALVAETFS